jgi:predicted CopG family antitoxin
MPKHIKKKSPSRVRYEQAHPTVSCRVPQKIYDRLQAVKEMEGRSFADILKVGLGLLEVRAKGEAEIRKQGHAEGYKRGYAEAEGIYKITYPCNVCGKILAVTSTNAKEDIRQYMQENGWGHRECHEKSQ